MNGKTSINSICPNLWAPTAGLLQGLTVLQQCVYQKKFKNVCNVKKWLVEPVLVRSRTCQASVQVSQWANTSSSFTVVKKWITEWNVSHSVRNVNKMCFYALCQLSNHIASDKKVIFCWLCFPQVVQKQKLSEVENWIIIWWQVVSGIFMPKIIKIWQLVLKLQSKMSGVPVFFETQCRLLFTGYRPLPELHRPQLHVLDFFDLDECTEVRLRTEQIWLGRQHDGSFAHDDGCSVVEQAAWERQPVSTQHAPQVLTIRRQRSWRTNDKCTIDHHHIHLLSSSCQTATKVTIQSAIVHVETKKTSKCYKKNAKTFAMRQNKDGR